MRRHLAFILALLVCMTPGVAEGQKSSKKHALLDQLGKKMEQKWRSLKSLSQTVNGGIEIGARGDVVSGTISSSVVIARGGRFRVETAVQLLDKDVHATIVSDGKTVWELNPDAKEYSELPFSTVGKTPEQLGKWVVEHAGGDLSLAFFIDLLTKGMTSSAGRHHDFQVKDPVARRIDGRPVYLVEVTGLVKPGTKGGFSLYVDASDFLLRRTRMKIVETKGGLSVTVNFVFSYSDVIADKQVSDDEFTFTPPADATKVERVKPILNRLFSQEPPPPAER